MQSLTTCNSSVVWNMSAAGYVEIFENVVGDMYIMYVGEKYFGNRVTHIFPLKINIKGKIPY